MRSRAQARGKFLFAEGEKLYVRGVTYGTFRPDESGNEFRPQTVSRDFELMAAHGINTVRTYTPPPRWLLDEAARHGLRVMVGIPWEQHVTFLDDRKRVRDIERRVREAVRPLAGHPAVLWHAIGNEIPAPIARWHGAKKIERFIERLYRAAKDEDPEALVTYVNYPTTEYLDLPFLDLVCFNVFLEDEERYRAYLARLQNVAGDRPLMLTEIGLDSRTHGEDGQAASIEWQLRAAFAGGVAGAFVFSWTDEWHRGGHDIENWDFGISDRDRHPKPALQAVERAFAEIPFPRDIDWPRISVVVCTYNGAPTIEDCMRALATLDYPNYEVIVVNDGSNDRTAAILSQYDVRVITTENRGLSSARNTGLEAAGGEIVAYTDDDAYPDPHWLKYLAMTFMSTDHMAVGGPNVPPPGDGRIAEAVANSPGGPIHVLLTDEIAEHIPGCNMAFRAEALRKIGGFDARFRAAGDDVDVCWRIQDEGWTIGFSSAAMVWHHRRNSARAYWRQQKGYGKAEALLEAKWPNKYNGAGHVTWGGRVYGTGGMRSPAGRVYHGVWGSAPFQRLYQLPSSPLASLPAMPEWNLLVVVLGVLTALGAFWHPLLLASPVLAAALGVTVARAIASGARTKSPRVETSHAPLRLRVLTTLLHLVQPVARLTGRIRHGLTPWRRRGAGGLVLPRPRSRTVWSERWRESSAWLHELEQALRDEGVPVAHGGEFDRWDLEVRAGALAGVRIRMAVEEHGGGRQLVRIRSWPRCSIGALAAILILAGIATAGIIDHGHVAGAILGAMAALLTAHLARAMAAAKAAVRRAIGQLRDEAGS